MAISHSHLTLLLLLSFFWLPTLLAIPFEDCGEGSSPVNVTSVEIIKDKDMASFQISGSTSKSISEGGYMSLTVKLGFITVFSTTYDPCEYLKCPVAPGAFVLPFDKRFSSHSPAILKFYVNIDDEDGMEIMCLTFYFEDESSVVVSA